jgi:hypothetical protein
MLDNLLEMLKKEPVQVLLIIGVALVVSAVLQYLMFMLGRKVPGITTFGEVLRWITRPLFFLVVWCGIYTAVMVTMPVGRHWYVAALFALFVSILGFGFLLTAVKRV